MWKKYLYAAGFAVLFLNLVHAPMSAQAAEGNDGFFKITTGPKTVPGPASPMTNEAEALTPEAVAKRWQEANEKLGGQPAPVDGQIVSVPVKEPIPPRMGPVPVKAATAKPGPGREKPDQTQRRAEPLPVAEKSPMPRRVDELPPEVENYKKVVEDQVKQYISPNKVQFARLSRNYINHIRCKGKIEKLVAPQDQALEAEIANDGHDLLLRVGMNPNVQFPVDLTIVCDGQIFILNAVVRPEEPSKQIVLQLPAGARPLSEPQMRRYSGSIANAASLPIEEQVAKIVKRIYQGDHLPYWQEIETPTSSTKWNRDGYSALLQKVIRTNIDGIVSWDFIFRGGYHTKGTYDVIRNIVRGEIIAFGRVDYEGLGAARVIVLTREDAIATASLGGEKP